MQVYDDLNFEFVSMIPIGAHYCFPLRIVVLSVLIGSNFTGRFTWSTGLFSGRFYLATVCFPVVAWPWAAEKRNSTVSPSLLTYATQVYFHSILHQSYILLR